MYVKAYMCTFFLHWCQKTKEILVGQFLSFIFENSVITKLNFCTTLQILCIGTDRSQQTGQTKIRLLLKKQSDQGLRCLPFHQHLSIFRTVMAIV